MSSEYIFGADQLIIFVWKHLQRELLKLYRFLEATPEIYQMSYRTLTRSFSRTLVTPARFPYRSLSTSLRRNDILSELEEKLHPRELVERKRKLMEEKYGEKLKKAAEK